MAAESALVQVLENLWDETRLRAAWAAVNEKRWYFGNGSLPGQEAPFWKMDLDGDPRIDALFEGARGACEKLAGQRLRVLRQYANGHTYGLGGRPHADDRRPDHYTLLCYPMPEWNGAWGGETVYYHGNGEIALSVLPKPGRAVFFDARIAHAGRAPAREYGGLRVTVAFKLGPLPAPEEQA